MNCCGESRQAGGDEKQVQAEPTPFLVNQQPTGHPGAHFRQHSFTPPDILPPPATYNGNGNGYDPHKQQMTQTWASTGFSSPGATSPAVPPTSYTPLLDPNVIRPNPVHAIPTPPMSITSPSRSKSSASQAPTSTTLVDEGKMSISIDFGKYVKYITPAGLKRIVIRYYFFWCGMYSHEFSLYDHGYA